MGEVLIFFFLWLCTPFSTAFLAFRALDLASVLADTAKGKETQIAWEMLQKRHFSVKVPPLNPMTRRIAVVKSEHSFRTTINAHKHPHTVTLKSASPIVTG